MFVAALIATSVGVTGDTGTTVSANWHNDPASAMALNQNVFDRHHGFVAGMISLRARAPER